MGRDGTSDRSHRVAWNRQAAMFAAILRRESVLVRSWKPSQIEDALAWLAADLNAPRTRLSDK